MTKHGIVNAKIVAILERRKTATTNRTLEILRELTSKTRVLYTGQERIDKALAWISPIKVQDFFLSPADAKMFLDLLPCMGGDQEWRFDKLPSAEQIAFSKGSHPLVLVRFLSCVQEIMDTFCSLLDALLSYADVNRSEGILMLMSNGALQLVQETLAERLLKELDSSTQ